MENLSIRFRQFSHIIFSVSYGQQMAKFAVTVLYSQQNGRLESSYVFG